MDTTENETMQIWCAFWAQAQKFPRLKITTIALEFDCPNDGVNAEGERYLAISVNYQPPTWTTGHQKWTIPILQARFGESLEGTIKSGLRELEKRYF